MKRINRHARAVAPRECLGLLAAKRGAAPGLATITCLLPARASESHAEATPLDLARAAAALRGRGLKPVGLWHSHGDFGVHHSPIDDATVARLLPAMAEVN